MANSRNPLSLSTVAESLAHAEVIMAFVAINNLWNAKELAKTVFPELEVTDQLDGKSLRTARRKRLLKT